MWWGHRIPAWHCAKCGKITVARPGSGGCAHCGSGEITQETDVLDTWFSSGLLPVSVFGWPNVTAETRADFDTFYPTSLLVTGFDILFFWVARMIMLGCWFSPDFRWRMDRRARLKDSVPFREVYIHALVRDANREKMSKTKGNVIDPIEIVKQYGTDAVRFTLASMASPGTDIAFNVARTEGYRAFANKIWNAARFIFKNVDRAAEIGIVVDPAALGGCRGCRGCSAGGAVDCGGIECDGSEGQRGAGELPLRRAANIIYQFFWGSFCDWYLEIVKLRLDFSEQPRVSESASSEGRCATYYAVQVFEAALRLLSPFMPFLTEELWHALYDGKPPAKSIALTQYPQATGSAPTQSCIHGTRWSQLQSLIVEVRALRKEIGVEEKAQCSNRGAGG